MSNPDEEDIDFVEERFIAHPMEEALGIEAGTTLSEYKPIQPAAVVEHEAYDDKDVSIEEKIEEVYAMAMSNAEVLSDEIERVEGKYKARMGEVAATMMNVALGAIREQSSIKQHKDKLKPGSGSVNGSNNTITNNNLVVANRNEILELLKKGKTESE